MLCFYFCHYTVRRIKKGEKLEEGSLVAVLDNASEILFLKGEEDLFPRPLGLKFLLHSFEFNINCSSGWKGERRRDPFSLLLFYLAFLSAAAAVSAGIKKKREKFPGSSQVRHPGRRGRGKVEKAIF